MPARLTTGADGANAHEEPGLDIGTRLKSARGRMGVTIVQAAERLHLDATVIQALEEQRFESLGAPVYVRGHLRRYAEFLGEPGAPLQDQYAGLLESTVEPDLRQVPNAFSRRQPRSFLWPAVLIAGVLALIGIVWWALGAQPAR